MSRLRGPALVLLALVVLLGAGCASDEERFAEHRGRAEEYIAAGQSREALLELRSALSVRPTSAEVNFRMAEILNASGQIDGALFHYGEARRLDPDNAEAALAEAMLLRWDDPKRARELVEALVERFPSNPIGSIGRAQLALLEPDTDAALTAARTAVELDPEHPEAYFHLGVVFQARIREVQLGLRDDDPNIYEKALAAFERSRELSEPAQHWRTLINQAAVHAAWEGHEEQAQAAFREAVALAAEHGGDSQARRALGELERYAVRTRDEDLLRWALERSVEIDGSNLESWRRLALLSDPEDRQDQDEIYTRMRDALPEDPVALVVYARHVAAGPEGILAAVAFLEERVGVGIDPPRLLEEITRLELQRGDLEAARATLARLEREDSASPHTRLARSRIALDEGRARETVQVLRDLAGEIESRDAQILLARAEFALGRHDAALHAIERGLRFSRGFDLNAVRLRINVLRASGDCSGALRSIAEIQRESRLELTKDERLLQAECFYAMGLPAKGRARLRRLSRDPGATADIAVAWARFEGARAPERARVLLEKALAGAPTHPQLLIAYTDFLLRQGKPEEASQRLDAVLTEELGTLHPILYVARARARFGAGDVEGAAADGKRALELAPTTPGALAMLAALHRSRGELAEARALLEDAASRGALAHSDRLALASVLLEQGETARARAELERLLSADPDSVQAKNDLAWLLAEDGDDLDRALRLAQEARQALDREPLVADTLGYVYLKRGMAYPAEEQFRTAIDLASRSSAERPIYHYHLGLALRRLGRGDEAREAIEHALAMAGPFDEAEEARQVLVELGGADSAAAIP